MLRCRLNGCSDWALSSKKGEDLEAMEFITNVAQFEWDAIIMPSLRRYYEVHGHTDVSQTFVVPSGDGTWPQAAWGHRLGNSVNAIRQKRRYRSQVEESEEELERLEFCYKRTIAERDWREKILPSLGSFLGRIWPLSGDTVLQSAGRPKVAAQSMGTELGEGSERNTRESKLHRGNRP